MESWGGIFWPTEVAEDARAEGVVVGRGAREVVVVCVWMGEVAVSVMFACFREVCSVDVCA